MKSSLSKNEQQLIKLSSILKFLGLLIILAGFIGVLIGVHKLYIIKTIESRYYDEILTLISVGIISFGYLIYIGYRTMEKLKYIHGYTNTNQRKI